MLNEFESSSSRLFQLCISVSACLSFCPSCCQGFCSLVCLSICLSVCLSVRLSVCPSPLMCYNLLSYEGLVDI